MYERRGGLCNIDEGNPGIPGTHHLLQCNILRYYQKTSDALAQAQQSLVVCCLSSLPMSLQHEAVAFLGITPGVQYLGGCMPLAMNSIEH